MNAQELLGGATLTVAEPARAIRRRLRLSQLLMAGLGLQAIVIVALAAEAHRWDQRLDSLAARTDAHGAATAKATSEVERATAEVQGLQAHSQQLEAGLIDLRQAVSSHAREETLFLKMMILRPTLDVELARRVAKAVARECMLSGRDPNLVLAIMDVESDFNPRAISPVGATGLMQVMPLWKRLLGIKGDLADPEVGIHAGVQVLSFYQEMYRELPLAVTAYNTGPGPVDWALVKGNNPANAYSVKVLATYERLRKLDFAARP